MRVGLKNCVRVKLVKISKFFFRSVANFDHSATNESKVLCSFISILVHGVDYFVSRPFATPKFKKEIKLFLRSYERHPSYCSPVSHSHYIFFTAQTMMPTGVLLFSLPKPKEFFLHSFERSSRYR